MNVTETLIWHAVSGEMPDSDKTVLIHCAAGSEPVWIGYHDGETWREVGGTNLGSDVDYWADVPRAPE